MKTARKYRLYPTASQRRLIDRTIGCCRKVYNLLYGKLKADKEAGMKYDRNAFSKALTTWKRLPEYKYLNEVSAYALVAVTNDFHDAVQRFFNNCKKKIKGKKGFPKPKKWSPDGSFSNQNDSRNPQNRVIPTKGQMGLFSTSKLKNVPIVLHRPVDGVIGTVTISKKAGQYFASLVVEDGKPKPILAPVVEETTVGIDLGLKKFITTSDGDTVLNLKVFVKTQKKLAYLKQRMQKMRDRNPDWKESKRYAKARLRHAKANARIENQRSDNQHKATDGLLKKYDTVCVENLNVSGMLKNRSLSKAISDVGFYETKRQLEYKAQARGKNIIEVNRWYPSSKTCSSCGQVHENLELKDREWACQRCGDVHDRDINAAINIKKEALATYNKLS